jgi:urease accessory protein
MGETITDLAFDDRRTIRRDGRALLIEPLSLRADAIAAGVVVLGGARAFASLVLVRNGAEDALGPVRQVLDQAGVQAAASGWDGKLVVRMQATDGWPLRQQILRVLGVLRQGRPLPRVWQI